MYKTKAKCFTEMLILSFFVFRSQGLLAAIPLSYILPGLIFIKLDPHSLFSREKLPAIALVIFGLIVSISGRFCWSLHSALAFSNMLILSSSFSVRVRTHCGR